MLARVFEGVMDPAERRASGSYYPPAALVREIVRAGLEAVLVHRLGLAPAAAERWIHRGQPPERAPDLRRLTVLDPAVGSGAFLLGALEELTGLRCAAGEGPASAVRRDVVAHSLFGVDLSLTAVRLAELRLWLALIAVVWPGAAGPARAAGRGGTARARGRRTVLRVRVALRRCPGARGVRPRGGESSMGARGMRAGARAGSAGDAVRDVATGAGPGVRPSPGPCSGLRGARARAGGAGRQRRAAGARQARVERVRRAAAPPPGRGRVHRARGAQPRGGGRVRGRGLPDGARHHAGGADGARAGRHRARGAKHNALDPAARPRGRRSVGPGGRCAPGRPGPRAPG